MKITIFIIIPSRRVAKLDLKKDLLTKLNKLNEDLDQAMYGKSFRGGIVDFHGPV